MANSYPITKTSKEVTDRIRSVRSVLFNLKKKGDTLAGKLNDMAGPFFPTGPTVEAEALDGSFTTPPDFNPHLEFFERLVDGAITDLEARDEALFDVNREIRSLRDERDEKVRRVHNRVGRLRLLVLAEFEDPRIQLLDLAGEVPREPIALLRRAGNVARVLALPNVDEFLGDAAIDQTFEPDARAAELQSEVDALQIIVDGINDQLQERDEILLARNEAMDNYDRVFTRTARVIEDYFRLVGDDEMADRVRPSESRPGRTEEEPNDDGGSGTGDDVVVGDDGGSGDSGGTGDSSDTGGVGNGGGVGNDGGQGGSA